MIKDLIKLANELDRRGLLKEADAVDLLIKEAIAPVAIGCAILLMGLVGCNDEGEQGQGIKFSFEDTNNYGCSNKIRVSPDAEMVSDTQTSVSYKWHCVDPSDPYNDAESYANITLQFDKQGPVNMEEISNGGDPVYCFNENPRVSEVDTNDCD